MKPVKILYFISDSNPTPEEYKTAQSMNAHVVFRLASAVPTEKHAIEDCDGVMGDVPSAYRKCPSADEAIEKRKKEVDELVRKANERVGDDSQSATEPLQALHSTQPTSMDRAKRALESKESGNEPNEPDDSDLEDESEPDDTPTPPEPAKPAESQHGPAKGLSHTAKNVGRGKPQQRPSAPPATPFQGKAETESPDSEHGKSKSPAWKPNS
jgi:hypothetical protein